MMKGVYPQSSSSSSGGGYNLGIVFQLIDAREWEGVISFFQKVPEAASLGRVVSSANDVMNLPLHEVCRQRSPPLTVLNLLLDLYPSALSEKGQNGYLPLHYACENGDCPSKVIKRLLELSPSASRCRNEDDALPLHLACKTVKIEENTILSILATHPEGFYMKDAHGKTPLEYTRNPHIRRTLEQMAPTLVEAAKAAYIRNTEEFESRARGIEEAHAEYIRQLNLRQQEERNETIVAQIELQEGLAAEKERNIGLAELIIEKEKTEQELKSQLIDMNSILQRERTDWNLKTRQVDEEFRNILQESGDDDMRNVPVASQLTNLVLEHQLLQVELEEKKTNLVEIQEMVRNLNQLISSKDGELEDLRKKMIALQEKYDAQVESNAALQASNNKVQEKYEMVHQEAQRLHSICNKQQEQLVESNRLVRVQDSRLASIKSLAQSLNFNIESWALDDDTTMQQEWENTPTKEKISSTSNDNNSSSSNNKNTSLTMNTKIEASSTVLEGMETVYINKQDVRGRNTSTPNTSEESTLSGTVTRRDFDEDNQSIRSLTTPIRARILNA